MSTDALNRATRAVQAGAARAQACPKRPRFHFAAPSGWINDPNGTLWHDGTYHLFYQHNPYRPRWGRIHWGHARSRDLIHWEHLPVALAPGGGWRERHCFSGCCAIADDATPTILYTRIGAASLLSFANRWADQCAAFGDADLIRWRRYGWNPVLREVAHGGARVRNWRDPYVFAHDGRGYLVIAGRERGEPAGSVLLYRSRSGSGLLDWEYRGRLSLGDPSLRRGIECPNYFGLDGKWVLVVSPFGPVRYRVGDLCGERHIGGEWRAFDHGRAFYATNTFVDGSGRTVVVGWVRGLRGDGWAGCMSLPREVRLDGDGVLSVRPVAELETLRRDHRRVEVASGLAVQPAAAATAFPSPAVEVLARCDLADATTFGLEVRGRSGRHRFTVDLERSTIVSGPETAQLSHPFPPGAGVVEVRAFLDAAVLEVFVGDRDVFTSVVSVDATGGGPVEMVPFVSGGSGTVSADLWSVAAT